MTKLVTKSMLPSIASDDDAIDKANLDRLSVKRLAFRVHRWRDLADVRITFAVLSGSVALAALLEYALLLAIRAHYRQADLERKEHQHENQEKASLGTGLYQHWRRMTV